MMLSRREFSKLALAGASAHRVFAKPDSVVNGVIIGVQSYSFRDRPLDAAIKAIVDSGISYCELWSGHIEPKERSGAELRKWRTTVSMDVFRDAAKKFKDAGINVYAYNYSFRDDFSDEEIARGFDMAKALGAKVITSSSNVSTAKRIDQYARKARMVVGMHNHSDKKPNEFARPEDFEQAMRGASRYIGVNLDIGHFVAAGYDPVDYIAKHHDRIVTLHVKDRKKDDGDVVPFGEGDTPIRDVLQLLKAKGYKIPAMIEHEYEGGDPVVEVRKSLHYCRQALA